MTKVSTQESEAINLKDLLLEKTTERMKASLSEEEMSIFVMYTESYTYCLLYTSPSPRDRTRSRMPSSA